MKTKNFRINFTTQSGSTIKLQVIKGFVNACIDGDSIGEVLEDHDDNYSLIAQQSVFRNGRYINYTIVPQKKDRVAIRQFFVQIEKYKNTLESRRMFNQLIKKASNTAIAHYDR